MALSKRDDSLAAQWVRFRDLMMVGKPEQALRSADQMIAEASDSFEVAQALTEQGFAHFYMKNWDVLPALISKLEEQIRIAPHPRLAGNYHTLAATVAHSRQSYAIALLHLVEAERALRQMDERTRAAVESWNELAAINSRLGYRAQAIEAAQQGQSVCEQAGLPPGLGIAVYAYLLAALVLDQRGDTNSCVRELQDLVERSRPLVGDMLLIQQVPLRYAVRRLATLGHPVTLDVSAAGGHGPGLKLLDTFLQVCDALISRQPHEALAILDATTEPLDTFGAAERLRLRSLALTQLGDHPGALAVERAMFLQANQDEHELRALLVSSARARIDQDKLRRSAERHARAALTDPLTGLPNRRKVDEFTNDLTRAGKTATCGSLDLDGFKAINDNLGHPTGDVVLQRIACILAGEARPTDLVARQGGDEFVVVLPDTTKSEAQPLGDKIEAAIRDEDWHAVAPGIPIGISIGWAEIDRDDINAAFRSADAELYATKRRHHAHAKETA